MQVIGATEIRFFRLIHQANVSGVLIGNGLIKKSDRRLV